MWRGGGRRGGEPVTLLEHLARRMADAVLSADVRIVAVTVVLRKLRPPVAHDLASAGIRLTCVRPDR